MVSYLKCVANIGTVIIDVVSARHSMQLKWCMLISEHFHISFCVRSSCCVVLCFFLGQFTHLDIVAEPRVWTQYTQCIWLIRLFTQHDTLLHTHLYVDKDTRVRCPLGHRAHPRSEGNSMYRMWYSCMHNSASVHTIKIKAILMLFLSSASELILHVHLHTPIHPCC